ncbi:MAG: bifunctional adenosylcobinamide kinase/adenosylcobinamide-phosphate guanylyltransferase, partial [Clostridiales bacterium]
MIILVIGANSSGKSLYAEQLASRIHRGSLYYVATMDPYGEEGQARIAKHRRQRQGLGFVTVEKLYNVDEIVVGQDDLVLLEDVSNLLSNILFSGSGGDFERALAEINALADKCHQLIAVSIAQIGNDGYSGETKLYIEQLNQLNEKLQEQADMIVVMNCGKPF